MSNLNESHRIALRYLESKRPNFVSAEQIGREVGNQIGMNGWGRDFGLPLCNKLVDVGLVVQNDSGYYAAAANPRKKMDFPERVKIGLAITAVFCIPLLFKHEPHATWPASVALFGMLLGPGSMLLQMLWEEKRG